MSQNAVPCRRRRSQVRALSAGAVFGLSTLFGALLISPMEAAAHSAAHAEPGSPMHAAPDSPIQTAPDSPMQTAAQEEERPRAPISIPTNIWAISRGGQLYDKWWAVIEADPPTGTHPAYPSAGKKKGATTWRCKECHGWDYKGKDGAYSKGSHYSGIQGVRGVSGIDPARIREIITDKTHGFTEKKMSRSAMEKLALFLSLGQIDMDRYIDRATEKAHGNVTRGAQFFQTICANCHGFDGKEINFGDEKEPEYVGTVAQHNPWEALHKIRFGQPGVGMVSLSVLSVQEQVDILTYIQTLPAE